MNKAIDKITKHPIISSILAFMTACVTIDKFFKISIFHFITSNIHDYSILFAKWIWKYICIICNWIFIQKTPISNWLLIILCTISALLILFIIAAIISNYRNKTTEFPFTNYKSDIIFGARWFWSYYSDKSINFDSLLPYCPNRKCMNELKIVPVYPAVPVDAQFHIQLADPDCFILSCERCGYKSQERLKTHNPQDILNLTRKEIKRRILSGEYNEKLNPTIN